MNKEQLYETIEAYLEGKLPAEERRAFEQEIAADPELKMEVALHRRMHQELGKSGKAERRQQLQQIARDFPLEGKGRKSVFRLLPVWGAVAAAIVAAVIWWAWPRPSQPSWQQGPAVATERQPDGEPAVPDSGIAVNPAPEKKEEATSTRQKQTPGTPSPDDPFLPNPKLEGLIAAKSPNPDFLVSAEVDAARTPSENYRAKVSGTLRSGSPVEGGRILLQIYDNRQVSFLKERPAASLPLELHRLDDEDVRAFGGMKNYTFEKDVEKELPPGLYYYVVKREGEDTALYVGKVQIGTED
ncbi:MAG: hypothetical protein KDD10_08475 [Phaeodactylibacter sp.]|nr:hypothetical protein [Phaeodactylibacter sp.]MCB9292980.1 hypothetical protein [Lewinellaceae bacterium]